MKKETVFGTLEGALDLIREGDVLAAAEYVNEPVVFYDNLHTIAGRHKNITVWLWNTAKRYPFANGDEASQEHISLLTTFYGPDCRAAHPAGRVSLSPTNLSCCSRTIIDTLRPTVFLAAVSAPDKDGNFYISTDLQMTLELLNAADRVIFEVNRRIPVIYGDTAIPSSMVDYVYEVDGPISYAPAVKSSPVEEAVAGYVSTLINDGDCLQIGIGGTSNAVGRALTSKHELGIHTEMITSTMGELIRSGAVTNSRKKLFPGKTVGAFAWGDQALYDTLADNPDVVIKPSTWVNDPFVISQNDNVVSINTCLETDLSGQICSESIGLRQYSGTGGAFDFAYGAYMSKGGKGIIAMSSTAKDGQISKIKCMLTPGATVTITRNITDYIVTEYGIARMRGCTIRQRVENLIAVAHPDFRSELRRDAQKYMLW